jgi:heptosyltransferase-1
MSHRILIVKMSSMGDLVHALPVVSDLHRALAGPLQIDWVCEEGFAAIPALHAGVHRVIPIALRRWRRDWFSAPHREERRVFMASLRAQSYDQVIDLQGLIKSAIVARLARGTRHGQDWASAREPVASWLYQHRHGVERDRPAIWRNRRLAGLAMGYAIDTPPEFGLTVVAKQPPELKGCVYAAIMPSASRAAKLWPEAHWQAVLGLLQAKGITPWVLAGSPSERERATRLTMAAGGVLAKTRPLSEMPALLAGARMVVGLDSGLTHLAGALGRPTVGIYADHPTHLTPVTGSAAVFSLGGKGTPPSLDSVLEAVQTVLET